jgi:hypothetical protein
VSVDDCPSHASLFSLAASILPSGHLSHAVMACIRDCSSCMGDPSSRMGDLDLVTGGPKAAVVQGGLPFPRPGSLCVRLYDENAERQKIPLLCYDQGPPRCPGTR